MYPITLLGVILVYCVCVLCVCVCVCVCVVCVLCVWCVCVLCVCVCVHRVGYVAAGLCANVCVREREVKPYG